MRAEDKKRRQRREENGESRQEGREEKRREESGGGLSMTVRGTNSTIFHQSASLIMIVPVGTGKGMLLRQNIRQAHSKATLGEATTKISLSLSSALIFHHRYNSA